MTFLEHATSQKTSQAMHSLPRSRLKNFLSTRALTSQCTGAFLARSSTVHGHWTLKSSDATQLTSSPGTPALNAKRAQLFPYVLPLLSLFFYSLCDTDSELCRNQSCLSLAC